MRLHHIMPVTAKLCTKAYTLPKLPNQKEAVTISPGTTVLIPTKAIH